MKYDKFIGYHGKTAVVDVSAIERSARANNILDIIYEIEGDKKLDYIVLNFENITLTKKELMMKARVLELVFKKYNNVIAAGVNNSHKELGVEYHHFIEEKRENGKIYSSLEKAIKAVSKGYKR